jgi:Putative beta-barrel porin-2, OmpL-like. bbp2
MAMRRNIREAVTGWGFASAAILSAVTLTPGKAHAQAPSAPAPGAAPGVAPPPAAPSVAPVAPPPTNAPAPYPGQPQPNPYPGQTPYPGQVQPYPAQPYPGQVQPYPAQPYPAQPYPGQVQPYPAQPYPPTNPPPPGYAPQPYPGQAPPPEYPAQAPQNYAAPPPPAAAPYAAPLQPPPVLPPLPVEAPEKEQSPWYDKLSVAAFVDGYFSLNYLLPKPQDGRNRFRAYDSSNGFALSWVGLDVSYGTAEASGTVNLRFGPSASRLAGEDAKAGLENVKQAFATWRPGGEGGNLSFDLGKFDTNFGAEVADSQLNFNYTRGLLYWLAQPAFHTGLRVNANFTPNFWLTGFVANGWNNSVDNNMGKSFGLQLSGSVPGKDAEAPPLLDAHLGYMLGPEQVDNGLIVGYCKGGETFEPAARTCTSALPNGSPDVRQDAGDSDTVLRHLLDLVVGLHPSPALSFLLNADLGFERVRLGSADQNPLPGFSEDAQVWWGVSLAGRYQIRDQWAVALRGEVLGDPDGRVTAADDPYIVGVEDLTLLSATLTVDFAPTPGLLIRLDNRLDHGSDAVFPRRLRSYESNAVTSTLGVVVSTN